MKTKLNVLTAIEAIYMGLADSHLSDDVVMGLDADFDVLMNYLGVDREEALLFALVFSFQITDSTCDYRSIAKYLRVSEFRIVEFSAHLKSLSAKKICFDNCRSGRRHTRNTERNEHLVNKVLYSAILDSKPFPEKEIYYIPSAFEWIESMRGFIDDELEYIEPYNMEREIDEKLNEKLKLNLPQFIEKLKVNRTQKLFLIFAIWEALIENTFFSPDNFFSNLPKSKFIAYQEKKNIFNGSHPFILKNILTTQPAQYGNDMEVGLTDEFKAQLKDYGLEFESQARNNKSKVSLKHGDIKAKELFYNEEEQRQLTTLTNLLQVENFSSLQNRMKERGLPVGVSVLFFGSPGTGKTESVLQLARLTGRDIIQVDISESKSMWFGQSEKIVKRIFTDYKAACEEREIAPILFINEADAILAKRNSGESNVKQTENAIQNILLEEMEKLEGILIATTNLEINLDTAFDRRFLFKVKYRKPGILQRQKIWQDKLPNYTEVVINELATQFNLSGGQIDNIVRKTEIDYVLKGAMPSEKELFIYCADELSLGNGRVGNRIGF